MRDVPVNVGEVETIPCRQWLTVIEYSPARRRKEADARQRFTTCCVLGQLFVKFVSEINSMVRRISGAEGSVALTLTARVNAGHAHSAADFSESATASTVEAQELVQ